MIDEKGSIYQQAAVQQASRSFAPLLRDASMHDALRTFAEDADKVSRSHGHLSLERLIDLAAHGRLLAAEYAHNEIPPPVWLAHSLRLIREQIKETWRYDQMAKLVIAERELEELRSREEKRKAKEEEVRQLRNQLSGGS